MKDGDSEYLGLEVGGDGKVIEFPTLSSRQPSSRSDVGQGSDVGHFIDQNFRSQKFKCIILGPLPSVLIYKRDGDLFIHYRL